MNENILIQISDIVSDAFVTQINGNDIIFQPENDLGYIEYKRTLLLANDYKLQKYATQMQFRVYQNIEKNIAIYYIGIDDDGTIIGINNNDILENILKFKTIVDIINAKIISIFIIDMDDKKIIRSKVIKNVYIDYIL